MAVILSDTDCIIDYLKGKAPTNGAVRRALVEQALAVNAVTAYELYYGEPSGPRRTQLDQLLDAVTVIPLSREAAAVAGEEGARLAAAGLKLDAPDLLIAGTAVELNLTLITRNVRHFSRINGLRIEDPN